MSAPQFYVVARVVGSEGSLEKWKERLVPLCEVSATEEQGTSYYWGRDLDGEPDTLWGLEGYTHATGFFMGHPASEIFKREMALIDQDKLLKHEQGLTSRDYNLHHYDLAGGWLTREDDPDKDSKVSHVAVYHFWAHGGKRKYLVSQLSSFAERIKEAQGPSGTVQSCAVLAECRDLTMATLWIRTKTEADFRAFHSSTLFQNLTGYLKDIVTKSELHQSENFNGHIDKKKHLE